MQFIRPTDLESALAAKAAHPDAVVIAGGTDVMVGLNFDRLRPETIIDLAGIAQLRQWSRDTGTIRLGSGVPYTRIIAELADELPGLALASRGVGSPQIRNRGTVGGNLATASPAGDSIPPLVASDAQVELTSVRGSRLVAADDFIVWPRQSLLEGDELITAIHIPIARGPQQFAKIGSRNAMVIAVASFALSLDEQAHTVGTGIGSAGPIVIRARDAESRLLAALDGRWHTRDPLPLDLTTQFGEDIAAAAQPISDVRGTAEYRRHALSIIARRTLTWAWGQRTLAEAS